MVLQAVYLVLQSKKYNENVQGREAKKKVNSKDVTQFDWNRLRWFSSFHIPFLAASIPKRRGKRRHCSYRRTLLNFISSPEPVNKISASHKLPQIEVVNSFTYFVNTFCVCVRMSDNGRCKDTNSGSNKKKHKKRTTAECLAGKKESTKKTTTIGTKTINRLRKKNPDRGHWASEFDDFL